LQERREEAEAFCLGMRCSEVRAEIVEMGNFGACGKEASFAALFAWAVLQAPRRIRCILNAMGSRRQRKAFCNERITENSSSGKAAVGAGLIP